MAERPPDALLPEFQPEDEDQVPAWLSLIQWWHEREGARRALGLCCLPVIALLLMRSTP